MKAEEGSEFPQLPGGQEKAVPNGLARRLAYSDLRAPCLPLRALLGHWRPTSSLEAIYIYLYISGGFPGILMRVSEEAEKRKLAIVVWEGDSGEVLKAFPEEVAQNLGFGLWQLQQGERPRDYRPLPSVGPGVFELRDQDQRAW